jgi:uncharacterized membrane protein YqgA involved in biofilm formation
MRAWVDRHLHWTAFIIYSIASYFVMSVAAASVAQDYYSAGGVLSLLVAAPLALWLGYKKRRSKWYIPALILLPLLGFVLENKNTK